MKTEMISLRKHLSEQIRGVKATIERPEEDVNVYVDHLEDEEKELAVENWSDKIDELYDLQSSLTDWEKVAKTIK